METGKDRMEEISDCERSLASCLEEAQEIVGKVGDVTNCSLFLAIAQEIEDKLDHSLTNITVVGSPNTGKSSLINQLIDRQLLPTSAVSQTPTAYIQSGDGDERFGFEDELDKWYPIETFRKRIASSSKAESSALFSLHNKWLQKNNFCLVKMPSLNVSDEEIETELILLTKESDCLILAIDASAPMRRNETKLLTHAVKQEIPTAIVITKVDRLLEEEYSDTIEYVDKFAKACSCSIRVIPFSDRDANTSESIQTIQSTVEDATSNINVSKTRANRAAYALTIALDAIALEISSRMAYQEKSLQESGAKIRKQRHDIDVQNLNWQRIKQKLNARRRKVERMLKLQLQSHHSAILDGLLYELDSSENFREWWRRDFTAQLALEVQKTAEKITETINNQAVSDIEWLQSEAHKHFNFPLENFDRPDAFVGAVSVPPKSIVASDDNTKDIVDRIGTVAAAILTRVFSTRFGYRNAEIAASTIAGIATEQFVIRDSSQERSNIRSELSEIVKKVERAYALEATKQLEESYRQIVVDLQHQQSRWQQAQVEKLNSAERDTSELTRTELNQLQKQIEQLRMTVKSII